MIMITSLELANVLDDYKDLRPIAGFLREHFVMISQDFEEDIYDLQGVISSKIWNEYFRKNIGFDEFMRLYTYTDNDIRIKNIFLS